MRFLREAGQTMKNIHEPGEIRQHVKAHLEEQPLCDQGSTAHI